MGCTRKFLCCQCGLGGQSVYEHHNSSGNKPSTLVKRSGTCARLEPASLRNMGKKQGDSTQRKVGVEGKGIQGEIRG